VLKTERNMRVHFLSALFIILLGVYFGFSSLDIMILTTTITLVLAAEMINTAIEHIVDMIQNEFHPVARVVKDMGAGVVLLTAINAVIVGYALFARKFPFNIDAEMARVRQSPWHMTFIAIILVLGLSILGKIVFHKGTPLRGGMPSGHAAVAFSIWTIVAFLSNNTVVVTLAFVMAFLIARHRIKDAVHTFWEVLAGSILGVLVTTMIFQFLR
jgi:diacylglycerol kinase (ATP)